MARFLYGENYTCLPMKHKICTEGSKKTVMYQWEVKNQWCELTAQTEGAPELPREGSLEQFITEHYWGYSPQRRGRSLEYHVSHVPWKVWVCTTAGFEGDAGYTAWNWPVSFKAARAPHSLQMDHRSPFP